MKSFVIIIPRDELQIFCQAVAETITGASCRAAALGLQKYSVSVFYPEWVNPRLFVDLGNRFNELLKNQAQEV